MDGCLACKSCTGQCPIKVDVPSLPRRSSSSSTTGATCVRSRDYVVGSIEHLVPLMARMPGMSNALAGRGPGRALLRTIGLVDTPALIGREHRSRARRRAVSRWRRRTACAASDEAERARSVVLVQDAFTSYYETPLLLDLLDLIQALGFRPWLAPYRPNGKALHVHGFLGAFERIAAANAAMLQDLAATGVDLVGLDPSMTLTYRVRVCRCPGREPAAERAARAGVARQASRRAPDRSTDERSTCCCRIAPSAPPRRRRVRDWQTVFAASVCGLTILPSGCCGMAGT